MPASEIEVMREQQIAEIRHGDEDPDGRLNLLVNQQVWKGHPYENLPQGTLEVVQKLTRDPLLEHLARLRETSRLVLVVAGDVDPAKVIETTKKAVKASDLQAYAKKHFGKLQVVLLGNPKQLDEKLATSF